MPPNRNPFLIPIIFCFLMSVVSPDRCLATIYKYQKDGIWYYTDAPPADMPTDSQQIIESPSPSAHPSQDGRALLENYPSHNPIEKAVAGTVAIKSALGFGSGFFISPYGHIITNKHVIRSTEQQTAQYETRFRETEERIAQYDRQFAEEAQRLRNFKSRLDQLKSAAEKEDDPHRKQAYTQDYLDNLDAYKKWQTEYDARQAQYEDQKSAFKAGRAGYAYSKSVADLSQSFTVILADKTELYARLLTISSTHDLALLKLDGYRVPALAPAGMDRLTQGIPVYAIGSPAQLQNSVTSGIFSGLQSGYLQTNAQIYPGNSGGPLVDETGRVLGINTFKKLTHKFEGLGFAIPIQTALAEFRDHLPTEP